MGFICIKIADVGIWTTDSYIGSDRSVIVPQSAKAFNVNRTQVKSVLDFLNCLTS